MWNKATFKVRLSDKMMKTAAFKTSLTLHVVDFAPLLLQLLLQGFTLPLQAR